MESIKKFILEEMNINVSFQDVLAKKVKTKKHTIETFGIDELLKISIEKAKNAIDSSCNQALRTNCHINISYFFEERSKKIQDTISKSIENNIAKIEIGDNIENASKIIGNIICGIFLEYLSLENHGDETQNIISKFTKYYFEQILKLYTYKLKKMVKEESGAIANDIMDIQIQINMKNQGCFNFKNQMSKEMILENEYSNLFDFMKDFADLFCQRNAYRYIWRPINMLVKENLGAKYKILIDTNEGLRKQFDDYAEKAFNQINNNIKNL